MGKPITLALVVSLLAMPIACGDDDDDAPTGGKGGTAGGSSKGGTAGAPKGGAGVGGAKGGTTGTGGTAKGGTAGKGGTTGGTVVGGAGAGGVGGAGAAGEAGSGGVETAGAGGVGGVGGVGGWWDDGVGGEAGAPNYAARATIFATQICSTAGAILCEMTASCTMRHANRNVSPACDAEYDAVISCTAGSPEAEFSCQGASTPNAEWELNLNDFPRCVEVYGAWGACLNANPPS